ncbi:hypothetical protein [Helicobacter sp. 23-1045]
MKFAIRKEGENFEILRFFVFFLLDSTIFAQFAESWIATICFANLAMTNPLNCLYLKQF